VYQKTLLLLLIFAVCFSFSNCAYMSTSGRQQMAYRHYVQKQMKQRQRATARAQKAANREMKLKMKSAQLSEPKITTTVDGGSGSWSEPVAPPVTVSASSAVASGTDNQPAQP
jgi:hypothetical protein